MSLISYSSLVYSSNCCWYFYVYLKNWLIKI